MSTGFDYNILKGYILSPGNVFWVQKSGSRVLVSAKGDVLNLELATKLHKGGHSMVVEDLVSENMQVEFVQYFSEHNQEVLVKNKMKWRNYLFVIFNERFGSGECNQFELDQLMWRVFSEISHDEAKELMARDIDLFKRSMSIAASYTLLAYILGYYNEAYLKTMFTNTFKNLMDVDAKDSFATMREKLEELRLIESLDGDQCGVLNSYYSDKNYIFNERFDGTGKLKIVENEMNELEKILLSLNSHFSFFQSEKQNVLQLIKESKFKCDTKVLKMIQRSLERESRNVQAENPVAVGEI